jgi:3-oxoacyl-[acyl-carrier protein] reductase
VEKSLKDKTAIVTGSSRGIGKEIALILGKMGASVVINYTKNAELAEEAASEITSFGAQAISVKADISKIGEIETLFDAAIGKFGFVNILINNAGVPLHKKIEEVTEKEFDNIFATNVKGLFFACQYAARKMTEGGRIINISSSVTKLMLPGYGPYAATKGAVNQITKVLAKELGHRCITVNAISPGPTDTELFRKGKTEEQISGFAKMAALGRLGTPIDIARAVSILVSEEAGWITGQNIFVNGGFVA